MASLEGWSSTTELHLHISDVYYYSNALTKCQAFFKYFFKKIVLFFKFYIFLPKGIKNPPEAATFWGICFT